MTATFSYVRKACDNDGNVISSRRLLLPSLHTVRKSRLWTQSTKRLIEKIEMCARAWEAVKREQTKPTSLSDQSRMQRTKPTAPIACKFKFIQNVLDIGQALSMTANLQPTQLTHNIRDAFASSHKQVSIQ
jgi:hypothetical protein